MDGWMDERRMAGQMDTVGMWAEYREHYFCCEHEFHK
jgi:hypothetical protein